MSAEFLTDVPHNHRLSAQEALALIDYPLEPLMRAAVCRRDAAHGPLVSYSRKSSSRSPSSAGTFATTARFAHPPRPGEAAYLSPEQVLAIARAGQAAGCKEALFTLGDKPEMRYRIARQQLDEAWASRRPCPISPPWRSSCSKKRGCCHTSTPACSTAADIANLRTVSVSQGIMLESAAERLYAKGGPHHGSPDKRPAARLETIRRAGEAARALHLRHPDRHRRNTRGAHRGTARTARPATKRTGTSRRSSSRISGRSRNHADGRTLAPPTSKNISGPLRCAAAVRAGDEHPGAAELEPRRVCVRSSLPASTTGAACRRSRPTTSIPEAPWPHLEVLARARRRPARNSSNGLRSTRPMHDGRNTGLIRLCASPCSTASMRAAGRAPIVVARLARRSAARTRAPP